MSVIYTKAIKGGKLKTTEMQVGETVTGTVTGFKEGKFGNSILLNVQGREIEVYPSGNLKYAVKDGKLQTGAFTTITREADGQTKNGYVVSRFNINQGQAQSAPAAAQQPVDVKAKLEAIRAGSKANG